MLEITSMRGAAAEAVGRFQRCAARWATSWALRRSCGMNAWLTRTTPR